MPAAFIPFFQENFPYGLRHENSPEKECGGKRIRIKGKITGWIIAMQQMCVGDKWEIYLPAEMGYGKFSQPGIPGGSTLIFEIELLGID